MRRRLPWRALVVVASFDSLREVVGGESRRRLGRTFGAMLAGQLEKSHRARTGVGLKHVRPADLAARLRAPTLIAHGTADIVVPMESGRRLYDSLPGALARKWIEIPNAGHDNVLTTDYPIYAEMAAWFLAHVPES